ncbi:hypothetical protein ACX1N5_00785 [Acinetobacter sp. ANC 4636]
MNQVQLFQIAQSLGIPPIIVKWVFFIFVLFSLIMLFLNVLEKMGVINWISKWINPKTDYQEEIETLNLLKDFKSKYELNNDDYPYAHVVHEQQELTLLNRFYESRTEDLYLLRYCISRIERKRAFRLSKHPIFPIFVKKDQSTGGYVLRKYVFKLLIYITLSTWIIIYAFISLGLLYILLKFQKELSLLQILVIYISAAILPLFIGWLCKPLLIPFHAKSFVELKKDEPSELQ